METIYNCIWEKRVDGKSICVNINCDSCGKVCVTKETECKDYIDEKRKYSLKKN